MPLDTERPAGADSAGLTALAGSAPDGVVPAMLARLPAGVYMTDDHRYYLNGQGPVPSVTTVLEVLSKPALVNWKARESARAMLRMQLYEAVTGTEDDLIKEALKRIDATRDKAASIGTGVHHLADIAARSQEGQEGAFQVSDEERPYLNAWRHFLAFLEVSGGQIVSSEKAVWSLNGYAGTYDLILQMPADSPTPDNEPSEQELWLVDIKTSKGYYPEYALQLAGYRWADWIVLPGDPRTYAMPSIDRTAVLHLRPDQYHEGWKLIEYPTTYEEDYLTFLGALEIWKWRKADRFSRQNLNTESLFRS